jgi:hypothetical protein
LRKPCRATANSKPRRRNRETGLFDSAVACDLAWLGHEPRVFDSCAPLSSSFQVIAVICLVMVA